MLELKEAKGEVVELPRRDQEKTSPKRARRAPRPTRRPGAPIGAWQTTALFCLCVLFVLAIGLALHAYQRSMELENQLRETVSEMQTGMQELKAGVHFGSTRQQLLLGMRDEILRVNEEISLGEAYRIAELLLRATDKYPSVDPVLLLSIGIVESGFERKARKPGGRSGPLSDLAVDGSDARGNARLGVQRPNAVRRAPQYGVRSVPWC